ncbi:MAG: diguanylate cyclase [Magnetococcales bacterium]|nr:diguanylate cyclase [Magnetococcales bacterium]
MFKNIGHKILTLVGIAVSLSLLMLLLFYTKHQEDSLLQQNERNMGILADSVIKGLQAVMLTGNADIAGDFSDNLKEAPGVTDFRILRLSGREAFKDDATIHSVNQQLGDEHFKPHHQTDGAPMVLTPQQLALVPKVEKEGRATLYTTAADGKRHLIFIAGIPLREECVACHTNSTRKFQGLVKLDIDLYELDKDIASTRRYAFLMLSAAVLMILLITFVLIRRTVVKPISAVTEAMGHMSSGNLDQKVPVIGKDELSVMATSFNRMSRKLKRTYVELDQEQNKLTTIILGAREGIVVSDKEGKVVLVNPAAEKLLGKTSEQIINGGFCALLDDENYIKSFLEPGAKKEDLPETHVYNNRVLNFYATRIDLGDKGEVGSAALIRDVTEEKKLQDKLIALSTTDGLTGLLNRRRLDELLEEELDRAIRYKLELAVLLFDVDHFKKFNDTYGHDQGDRVLQALAATMKEHFRDVDYPCRYGGEEFLAIMPNTNFQGAELAAERLRERVEAMVVDGLKVTISIGVSVLPSGRERSAEQMMKIADNALYQAKKAGRNRIQMASDDEV